jgi:hypothetical protein
VFIAQGIIAVWISGKHSWSQDGNGGDVCKLDYEMSVSVKDGKFLG